MARNIGGTVALKNGRAQRHQCFILVVFKKSAGKTLKLNAYRIVIAVISSAIAGNTSMPGTIICTDKL